MSMNDIQTFLSEQTPLVKNNCTILSAEDLGTNLMYHIGTTKMNNDPYVPRIGDRQADSEDRTVPRVTVSTCLLGCLYGYATAVVSALKNEISGFYIHKLPFEHCLKPTKKLVSDRDVSDEHWLVRYNKDTTTYQGFFIGRLVIESILTKPRIEGRFTVTDLTVLIEVTEDIPLTKKTVLKEGRYRLLINYGVDKVTSVLNALPVNKGEFDKVKKQTVGASLEKISPTFKW